MQHYSGYVGKGMLSAAVCGEIFTSPTPDMILNAITACNSQKGTLLVIKNYNCYIDNSGHLCFEEETAKFVEELYNFLAK